MGLVREPLGVDFVIAPKKVSKKKFEELEKLIVKLKRYKFDENLLTWLSEFLLERKQCIAVSGFHPMDGPVDSGVPPGTLVC